MNLKAALWLGSNSLIWGPRYELLTQRLTGRLAHILQPGSLSLPDRPATLPPMTDPEGTQSQLWALLLLSRNYPTCAETCWEMHAPLCQLDRPLRLPPIADHKGAQFQVQLLLLKLGNYLISAGTSSETCNPLNQCDQALQPLSHSRSQRGPVSAPSPSCCGWETLLLVQGPPGRHMILWANKISSPTSIPQQILRGPSLSSGPSHCC